LAVGFSYTAVNFLNIQGGPGKAAQSVWHHNFATVHHAVFSRMFGKKFFT